jgi:hypothetical protein
MKISKELFERRMAEAINTVPLDVALILRKHRANRKKAAKQGCTACKEACGK